MSRSNSLDPPVDDRALARLACRIHAALDDRAPRPHDRVLHQLNRLFDRAERLVAEARRFDAARAKGWHVAAATLARELRYRVTDVANAAHDASNALAQPSPSAPLSPRVIFEELQSLMDDDELTRFAVDRETRRLSVVTEPIELEGVTLGRFEIACGLDRLLRDRVCDGSLFRTVALDPNPASTDSSVTHPHVRDDLPCLGDASAPLRVAVEQGRLGDAFRLIDRVLRTYNDSSPYVSLDGWQSVICDDCGDSASSENTHSCSRCDKCLCSECEHACDACQNSFCRSCLETSDDDELLCADCRGTCSSCRSLVRQDELDDHDGLCSSCEEAAREAEDADADAEEPSDDSIQPTPQPKETHASTQTPAA
jgi:hypothetical protein